MKAAFYLGCTIPVRAQNYELSTRKIAEVFGIELVDLPGAGCCGYPVRSINQWEATLVTASVLAEAEAVSQELYTICTACTGVLTETAHLLNHQPSLLEKVNEQLSKIGKKYYGTVKVKHFARYLYEEVGEERIKEKIRVDLSELKFASHYGCHFLKPREAFDEFDSVENPQSLDRLIEMTGARAIRYRGKKECCGGACLAVDENLAISITKGKLDTIKAQGADGIILICPFCSVMYDSNQKKIETQYQVSYELPVLYYPQLLGLALGMDQKELGFQMNRVKAKELLARIPTPVGAL